MTTIPQSTTPTAFCVTGGGFTSLSMAMGYAHAFYQHSEFFDHVTHLGGISGGSWFQSQFVFSKSYFESVTGINGDNVTESVSNWGQIYEQSMHDAIETLELQDIQFTVGELAPSCIASWYQPNTTNGNPANLTIEDYWNMFWNELQYQTAWPASHFLFYLSKMLEPWISFPITTSYDFQNRVGFQGNATIVVGLALGPDIYSDDGLEEATLITGEEMADMIPLHFSAPPGKTGGEWWYYGMKTQPFQVAYGSRRAVGDGDGVGGGSNANPVIVDLQLNPDASIAEITTGSGSALGQLGSPTLFETQIKQALGRPQLNLTQQEQRLYFQGIEKCLPWGLQNISSQLLVPLSTTVIDDQQGLPPWKPSYRYLDGAFAGDSTSVLATIHRIQHDCKASRYDCTTQKPKVAVMIPGERFQFDTASRLFADCSKPDSTCGPWSDLGTSYSPQVFAEMLPAEDDPKWILYSNHSYQFNENFTTPYLESYVWRGDVTTVDNPFFGVEGGMVIDFVLFAGAYPKADVIIWPGYEAGFAWSTIYAPVAQEHADSIQRLLEDHHSISSFFTSQPSTSEPEEESPTVSPPLTATNGPTDVPEDDDSSSSTDVGRMPSMVPLSLRFLTFILM